MLELNPSLFAHIENDFALSGTHKLEGHTFQRTTQYLLEYLQKLKNEGTDYPKHYLAITEQIQQLALIELKIRECSADSSPQIKLKEYAQTLSDSLYKLQEGKLFHIPGGWKHNGGGHQLIYQIRRDKEGFYFTIINTGDGIDRHFKKSTTEKEMFNPLRVWYFKNDQTETQKMELTLFLTRLLRLQLPGLERHKATPNYFYENVLPSIQHLNAEELNPDGFIKEFGYTAGQLSGSCAQRSLHVLLKINSNSEHEYQAFIFKFKMHALRDFCKKTCVSTSATQGIINQIQWAIDNNLKILNTKGLFTPEQTQVYLQELCGLRAGVAALKPIKPFPPIQDALPESLVFEECPKIEIIKPLKPISYALTPLVCPLGDGENLLSNLSLRLQHISGLEPHALAYSELEELLLALPLTQDGRFTAPFYREIKEQRALQTFEEKLQEILRLLNKLFKHWFKDGCIPTFNALCLKATALLVDTHCASQANPSFASLSYEVLHTVFKDQHRNVYWATNHPQWDKTLVALYTRYGRGNSEESISLKVRYMNFYRSLLETQPRLNDELKALFDTQCKELEPKVAHAISQDQFQALYLYTLHESKAMVLGPQFEPLIHAINKQVHYEQAFMTGLRPILSFLHTHPLSFNIGKETYALNSPCSEVMNEFGLHFDSMLAQVKYRIKSDPYSIKALLAQDNPQCSDAKETKPPETSNEIQLKSDSHQRGGIRPQDIINREYAHLRGAPSLQIPLSLDYFSRNLSRLEDPANQVYLEANLFQPGLLVECAQNKGFLEQFDAFLIRAKRYFAGTNNPLPLLFLLRLNTLVGRFLALDTPSNPSRLEAIPQEVLQRLSSEDDESVCYVLNQYLFIALTTLIQTSASPSEEHLSKAYEALFYLQSHRNPKWLEDTTQTYELEKLKAQLSAHTALLPESTRNRIVKKALEHQEAPLDTAFDLQGTFPHYTLNTQSSSHTLRVDAQAGRIFKNDLARTALPREFQEEKLVEHLNIDPSSLCWMSEDKNYLCVMNQKGEEVHFYHFNHAKHVQMNWLIQNHTARYELQALTDAHCYYPSQEHTKNTLPLVLNDASYDYWRHCEQANSGLLVEDGVARYQLVDKTFWVLDAHSNRTPFILVSATDAAFRALHCFESPQFIINHKHHQKNHYHLYLPRYGLYFEQEHKQLIEARTKEQVVQQENPIHPQVSGLVLQDKDQQKRLLVPVQRFYAEEAISLPIAEMIPLTHDRTDYIAFREFYDYCSEKHIKPKQPFKHKDSASYISFQLQKEEPTPKSVADALYLAYLYLGSDQIHKAWNTLKRCTKLTGNPQELEFIRWICDYLPYLNKNNEYTSAMRRTGPYLACQLKALALMTDFLAEDRSFHRKKPPEEHKTVSSQVLALLYDHQTCFLKQLPGTIHRIFTSLHPRRRHLEHTFALSTNERTSLLDYFHKVGGNKSVGTLGYEWMQLHFETLMAQESVLKAQYKAGQVLSLADSKRLEVIHKQMHEVELALKNSTKLVRAEVPVFLPNVGYREYLLDPFKRYDARSSWHTKDYTPILMDEALDQLNSGLDDTTLVRLFPTLFAITLCDDPARRKRLGEFCTKTLIANRLIQRESLEYSVPFLCNLLYHTLENPDLKPYFSSKAWDFTDIQRTLHYRSVTPLYVMEAENQYEDVLKSFGEPDSNQASNEARLPVFTIPRLDETPLLTQLGLQELALDLKPHIEAFQSQHKAHSTQMALLMEDQQGDVNAMWAKEQAAGRLLFDLEQQHKQSGSRFQSDTILIQRLNKALVQSKANLKSARTKAWDELKKFVHDNVEEDKKLAWRIERESKARAYFSEESLKELYCRGDLPYSIELTGMSSEHVRTLHAMIHKALVLGLYEQTLEKIQTNLQKKSSEASKEALELLSMKQLPGLGNPAVVLLQHEEEKRLRPRQVSALESLLGANPQGGFNETVEKIIMGGGKSKVILPILAQQKAQGHNLVVIEVPQALLATQYVDLNRTTQRLFNKRAYCFEFHRDKNCSPSSLQNIYERLCEVMTQRSYLVTCGESIQALELKYLELLFSGTSELNSLSVWKSQVYWCEKIVALFRHHADSIIDEVHQGLWIKKKLNYTFGAMKLATSAEIKYSIGLYQLIDPEFLEQAPATPPDFDWSDFQKRLAERLMREPNSPLYRMTHSLLKDNPERFSLLLSYLTQSEQPAITEIPQFLIKAPEQVKAALAFFKQQITVLLPSTLPLKHNVNYGASQREGLSHVERTLAIPYVGNQIPNERCRFGNHHEAINNSIQMMLLEGIGKSHFLSYLEDLKRSAKEELLRDPYLKHSDETLSGKRFKAITELSLNSIDLDNVKEMNDLHEGFKRNRAFIFKLLQRDTLKQIHTDASILHSDAFNHVDLYRSTQGISGTPSNHRTYHYRLKYNPYTSLGTDGYILALIEHKNTPISSCDFTHTKDFIAKLFSQSAKASECRAIIDVNASFKGIANQTVAEELATYLASHSRLKHVLYFNEKDVLCAKDTSNPTKVIPLGTTDTEEINRLLGSVPNERFTYYSQPHTLGTDIAQAACAHAFVLLDDQLTLSVSLQGCSRMRALNEEQTLEFVVPSRIKHYSRAELLKKMAEHERETLLVDHLMAAKAQLKAALRRHLLDLIQELPSDEAQNKSKRLNAFAWFFIDTPSWDLFDLYGALCQKKSASEILESHRLALVNQWEACLNKANCTLTDSKILEQKTLLQRIIEHALPYCINEYQDEQSAMHTEVEIQKQIQTQKQVQTQEHIQVLKETDNEKKHPAIRTPWNVQQEAFDDLFQGKQGTQYMVSLNSLILEVSREACSSPTLFSDALKTSRNFSVIYTTQAKFFHPYMKPSFVTWYHIDKAKQLHAVLLTTHESMELEGEIRKHPRS
jgi:hypothetical protein